jgi:oxygen-independent coproporphyrinogen-3 oxidase
MGDVTFPVPPEGLLAEYDQPGPRYTSYPTADRFNEAHGPEAHELALRSRGLGIGLRPVSVYVHVPFCQSVCYYCACNKVITKDHSRGLGYAYALEREWDRVSNCLVPETLITQLHFGGGTPTFLEDGLLRRVVSRLRSRFNWSAQAECGIEVDPRTVSAERIHALRDMGFNRLSLGVQDFDPCVQKAVHREQSTDQVFQLMHEARKAGFESINVDLIYGLPKQTAESFARTLETLVALAPDRVALYGYAHLPERFKPQRRIDVADLPSAAARVHLLHQAIVALVADGYDYIGMDHFARPDDSLAAAKRQGRLHRNFQGYTTQPDCDLIGLGVSAISRVGASFAQNFRELQAWEDAVARDVLPVCRGIELSADDLLRQSVINSLMCHGRLDFDALSIAHLCEVRQVLAAEIADLGRFAHQGLLELSNEGVELTPMGWFFVRNIAMVFDRYLRQQQALRQYSRVL